MSSKSKLVALLLCIFLGFVGAHRFYVKRIGTGILWILTGGFFILGIFIDIAMICLNGFHDKDGNILEKWKRF